MTILRIATFSLLALAAVAACDCGTPANPDAGGGEGEGEGEGEGDDGGVPCPEGTEGCDCAPAPDECDVDLTCQGGTCEPCAFGSSGCPCDNNACDGSLICDDQTETCRALITCQAAQCAANQVCDEPSGQDATCLAECVPGYEWNAGSNSCDAIPSCTASDPGSLVATCDAEHKLCVGGGDGGTAACGACVMGYVDDGAGGCEENLCVNTTCYEDGYDCVDDATNGPTCLTGCREGFVLDGTNGACVDRVTCSELNCMAPNDFCLEASPTADAQCTAPSTCGAGFAEDPISHDCLACSQCYDGTVLKANVVDIANGGFLFGNICVCEVADGYFQDVVSGEVQPCDADGDGWMRDPLEGVLAADETNPLRIEEKCPERAISAFVLRTDDANETNTAGVTATKTLDIDTIASTYALPMDATSIDPTSGDSFAYLIEPRRLDDDADLDLRWEPGDQAPLKPYAAVQVAGAGRLVASEVNPLTKWCNDSSDDLNLDGSADVAQTQEFVTHTFPPTALRSAPLWYRMAYFVELDRGYWVADACQGGSTICPGHYVIHERTRDDGLVDEMGIDFQYGATDDNYWEVCLRSRDPLYAGGVDSPLQTNMDFARWYESCSANVGACLTSQQYVGWDGRDRMDPAADLTGLMAEPGPGGGLRFPGMGHASQFKCTNLRTTQAVDSNHDEPAGTMWDGIGGPDGGVDVSGDYAIQNCVLPEPRNTSATLPAAYGSAVNPRMPRATCSAISDKTSFETDQQYATQNFWVALRVPAYDDQNTNYYKGGCIDENHEWSFLCKDNSVGNSQNNFGELFCGCDLYRGDVDCSQSCEPAHTLKNRVGENGAIVGFWMCAAPSLSSGPDLVGGTFTLRGGVPLEQTPITPLCEVADCSSGLKLSTGRMP